ncbi:hypothetical protein B0A50_08612 [Salinomyces thailandicus]|uniref:WD40 repeat-like protein n=1 Tax=Salinomyces thailandicus TaxID=706561 RepID=A0A4U0TJF6_9PEZI|nr:hypothetical protein B0A50_08612 [Salinomyces thailandica]
MNTRTPIQPSNTPAVLSIACSASGERFTAALSNGVCCFRTDNCLTTYHPPLHTVAGITDGGYAIAEQLDDRYFALVGGGRSPAGSPNVLVFWDAVLGMQVNRFDFHEEIRGVRLSPRYMIVVLNERTIVFEHQDLHTQRPPTPPLDDSKHDAKGHARLRGPNLPMALYPTTRNPYAVASLSDSLLVLPAQTTGQVQLINLRGSAGSKRVLRAHNSALRQLCLSSDGSLLATASEQGTLVRVFNTRTTDQLFDFRRGVDHAIVLSLAFSPGERWLTSTSDKGTLHVFDLQPPDAASVAANVEKEAIKRRQKHRKSQSTSYATYRIAGGGEGASSLSGEGRSSPASVTPSAPGTAYQGSIQEYYGLRPVPTSASPPNPGPGISAMAALKSSPWAPKVFKDVRSVASATFRIGQDAPHWQGGVGSSWTTGPDGRRKRVTHPVPPLPNDPSGNPPKGLIRMKRREVGSGDDDGAIIHVIGGGSDARWEMFELLPTEGGGWALAFRGFRKYLERQFVD